MARSPIILYLRNAQADPLSPSQNDANLNALRRAITLSSEAPVDGFNNGIGWARVGDTSQPTVINPPNYYNALASEFTEVKTATALGLPAGGGLAVVATFADNSGIVKQVVYCAVTDQAPLNFMRVGRTSDNTWGPWQYIYGGANSFNDAIAGALAGYVTSVALAAMLASYATQTWVNTNFLALAAFTGANQSLGAAGFQNLPGGLCLQWGTASTHSQNDGPFTVVFPQDFTAVYGAVAISINAAAQAENSDVFPHLVSVTTHEATFLMQSANGASNATAYPIYWEAKGKWN